MPLTGLKSICMNEQLLVSRNSIPRSGGFIDIYYCRQGRAGEGRGRRDRPKSMSNYLPKDMLEEILSKLPVYSLLRLRWACKYFFDLISRDPVFIKKHLHHHHHHHYHSSNNINKTMVLSSFLRYIFLYKDMFDTSLKPAAVPIRVCKNYPFGYHYEILGSCHGLIYLRTPIKLPKFISSREFHDYFLWNPSTAEFKMLPPYHHIRNYSPINTVHGFGYDHTIDDYKVIEIEYLLGDDDDDDDSVTSTTTTTICIYTLASNSWTTKKQIIPMVKASMYIIDSISYFKTPKPKPGVLLNGALHWMIKSPLGLVAILCFDVVKEEHREIQIPAPINSNSSTTLFVKTRLQVLKEYLCIFLVDYDRHHSAELWMMKDYGVKESWTKLFTISDILKSLVKEISPRNKGGYFDQLELLKYSHEDGGIQMFCEWSYPHYENGYKNVYRRYSKRYLITYYPDKDKATIENTLVIRANVDKCYIESLVSVKSGKYLSSFDAERPAE